MSYLDQMGSLLLEKDLRESQEDSDVRRLARARTLVVLDVLDSRRQNRVLRFLEETELIRARPPDRPPIISLKYASLRDFELIGKQLLKGTDLTQAGLAGAELSVTHLEGTNLSLAHLNDAKLNGADLSGADLTNARITEEQLREAESLEGATMPDGQTLRGDKTPNGPTFEDWLKSKDR
jgi:uncharacterized protein YjbI with pentapeptide repeats